MYRGGTRMNAGMRRSGAFVVLLGSVAFLAACEDNRPIPGSEAEIAVPNIPTQSNQNIASPTLTVAQNFDISPGDAETLVWSEEFDGPTLDPEVWFFETGDGSEYGIPGWGNNELQYYLPDNAQISGGMLVITVREEDIVTDDLNLFRYTSARINTACFNPGCSRSTKNPTPLAQSGNGP